MDPYPDWNPKVINYRLGYVAGQLEPLMAQLTPAVPNPGANAMAILFTDVTPLAGLRIDFFVALQTDLGGGTGQSAS